MIERVLGKGGLLADAEVMFLEAKERELCLLDVFNMFVKKIISHLNY